MLAYSNYLDYLGLKYQSEQSYEMSMRVFIYLFYVCFVLCFISMSMSWVMYLTVLSSVLHNQYGSKVCWGASSSWNGMLHFFVLWDFVLWLCWWYLWSHLYLVAVFCCFCFYMYARISSVLEWGCWGSYLLFRETLKFYYGGYAIV